MSGRTDGHLPYVTAHELPVEPPSGNDPRSPWSYVFVIVGAFAAFMLFLWVLDLLS